MLRIPDLQVTYTSNKNQVSIYYSKYLKDLKSNLVKFNGEWSTVNFQLTYAIRSNSTPYVEPKVANTVN